MRPNSTTRACWRAAVPVPDGQARQPAQLAARRLEPRGEGGRLEHRTPYALRHTFASFAIVRMMGTSIEQIEKTYGHLLPDALDRGRTALEAFDTTHLQGQVVVAAESLHPGSVA